MNSLATKPARPGSVTAAVYIQYVLIALGLLSAVFAATLGDKINDAAKAELEKLDASKLQMDAMANVGGSGALGLVIGAVSTAVFLTLTVMVAKGQQWARVTTWVLSGLSLGLSLLGVLGMLALGADETISKATQAGHDAVGGWYGPWQTAYMIIGVLGGLAVIVLLALPNSHPYFRKAQAEVELPPEAYR
ncbi:MAG: hypothetical protein ACRD0P_21940 [Stackebrandtia sp.]